ncbi:microcephalin-like isoform X2 [Asterias amurensis]|uniref:microcephalin-like isoform X2 n=1 Tax=Asterias amurensis TaxID=7602 RepID=UPI003AB18103
MEFIRKRKSSNCLSLQKPKHHDSLTLDASITSAGVSSSADEAMLIDSDNENDIPDMEPLDNRVLKDVVAYVEVRTKTENRSNSVRKQLERLGATVVMRFTNDEPVTHVIWKDGKKSTKDKALKRGLHLVSVLWVDSCKRNQQHVAESIFPVTETDNGSPVIIPRIKRLKSMQPKSFEEDVLSSTERAARKRKRKALIQPLNIRLNSPGLASSIKPHVYVEETQDPYTPVGTPQLPGIKLTPSLIPDTPASMRACLDALSRVRNSGSTRISERLTVGDSPTSGAKPDILQKKLSFSPSVDTESTSAPSTEATNAKSADRNKKKGRRSEAIQGSAKKVSPKMRRLSLRIETNLSELEADEDCCLKATDHPDPKTTLAQRNLIPLSKKSGNQSDPSKTRTTKNVSFIKEQSDSRPEPAMPSQRKRKLLSSNSDAGLNQVLTEPTKSSKKENQPKESRRSSKSSRKLSEKFDRDCGSSDLSEKQRRDLTEKQQGDQTENTSEISKGLEKRKKEPRRSSKSSNNSRDSKMIPTGQSNNQSGDLTNRSPNQDELVLTSIKTSEGKKSSRGVKGTRKRKTDDLSSGSSEEETGKAAKKRKADSKEVLPASSTEGSHAPSKGDVTSSRRSLDDFSQRKKRIGRLKTKGRSKPRGNRTVSLATPHPDTRESSSEDDISAILRGKKGSRSLSLISKFWLDSSSDGSESSVCREKGARQDKSKTSKKGKSKPSLVMTSIHGGDQDLVLSVVKKLKGFSVEERVSTTTTHIVCGENRRTLNVLRGIARGCWFLSLEWVLKSLEAEKWLPEELYEIKDFFPSAKIARLERSSSTDSFKQDLFSTMGPVFIRDTTSPPKADLTELLELCCGQTCSNLKQASICIGGVKNQQNEVPVVSERWLLDCVTQHQQLPFEDYLL